jgi:dTMP kinase
MLIRLALARRLSGPNWVPDDTEVDAPAFTPLDLYTSALLFAADRTDHLATKIIPALEKGHHVISDRYTLSSLAYQGLHLPLEWVMQINRYAVRPDLTIFLDVPPRHAKYRMKASRLFLEDGEQLPRQELVQKKYREVIAASPEVLGPIHTIDASRPVGVVERAIQQLVGDLFETHPQPRVEELVLF